MSALSPTAGRRSKRLWRPSSTSARLMAHGFEKNGRPCIRMDRDSGIGSVCNQEFFGGKSLIENRTYNSVAVRTIAFSESDLAIISASIRASIASAASIRQYSRIGVRHQFRLFSVHASHLIRPLFRVPPRLALSGWMRAAQLHLPFNQVARYGSMISDSWFELSRFFGGSCCGHAVGVGQRGRNPILPTKRRAAITATINQSKTLRDVNIAALSGGE